MQFTTFQSVSVESLLQCVCVCVCVCIFWNHTDVLSRKHTISVSTELIYNAQMPCSSGKE